jgi:proline racemase
MLEKRDWLARHRDQCRRAILLEPRGHADMCGAILTEPVAPGSDAGVIFMRQDGYATMSGHGIIAATMIAIEHRLIVTSGEGTRVVFDTPAGTVRARRSSGRVAFENVPSFVLHGGLPVVVGQRKLRVDIAFGGAFYAIVDSEAAGLPIDAAHLPEIRRAGPAIIRAVEATHAIVHPLEPGLHQLAGTIFTGPPSDERSAVRNVTVFRGGEAERSPGGTGAAAVMAVVDAMGLMGSAPFVYESLIGTSYLGRISGRTTVGEYAAIVPHIEGEAWITGEHAFFIDENDPLKDGFRA